MDSAHCNDCQQVFHFLWNSKKICPVEQGGCGKGFCSKCLNYSCITEANASGGIKAPISTFCKSCFKKNSALDFDNYYETFGPEKGTAPAIVFIHGGGGCRSMFAHYAKLFAQKHGYRTVIFDLPGHGAKMDEPLTLHSANTLLQDMIENIAGTHQTIKPIAIGGSLGGYILMEFVGLHPTLLSGAVVTMCGQDVGPHRGWAAGLGLIALGQIPHLLSGKTLLSGLVSQAGQSGHLDEELILRATLRVGMFFDQADAQIAILRASDPRHSLPHCIHPILFVNGTKDHRDSEEIWLACCGTPTDGGENRVTRSGGLGQLIDYEGGDHFFSHDKRFMDRFAEDVLTFIQSRCHHTTQQKQQQT